MLKGVDISGYQAADFDFSSYDFGIVKVSEGKDFPNTRWEQQAAKCVSQGKLLGLYHYARPELNSNPQVEAEDFVGRCRKYVGKAILALDWEGEALNQPTSWAKQWMDIVHDQTGTRPFFYSSSSYTQSTPSLSTIAAKYPLWLAHYTTKPTWGVWKKWTIWQYQGAPLDLDYFDGTALDWQKWAGKIQAQWISGNRFLKNSEMENNAELIWEFFRGRGWTLESVCGMLGNMEIESTLSPGIWGNFNAWGPPNQTGIGLVQWTPYTQYTNWANSHGYSYDSGPGQCQKLQEQMEKGEGWIPAGGYQLTFQQFSRSTLSPSILADMFLKCFERPAVPEQPIRGTKALNWYAFLRGAPIFEPRLTSQGMQGNSFWYSNNPFWQAGFGLPNCTCYVWGRWWEISGVRPDKLSLGNGATFYPRGVAAGIPHGQVPQLGAIICWDYDNGLGHVAVVEQINADGSIIISESGYGGWYFNTETLYPPNYWPSWKPLHSGWVFQGFLYLDTQPTPPTPEIPPDYDPPEGYENKLLYYLKLL